MPWEHDYAGASPVIQTKGKTMDYVCDKCGKRFRLYDDTTLDDLFKLRVLYTKNVYWHWTCARIFRNGDGTFYVEEPSKGRLVKEDGNG